VIHADVVVFATRSGRRFQQSQLARSKITHSWREPLDELANGYVRRIPIAGHFAVIDVRFCFETRIIDENC
jgi:hypothetical protein